MSKSNNPKIAQEGKPYRFKPKFHEVPKSILLISKGIAQNSPCGYWEHPEQFVSPGLRWRRLRHLPEG
jgi:hypothetical protein